MGICATLDGEDYMTTGEIRGEIDVKIAGWERELERVRLALARGPDAVHERLHSTFIEVYQAKEILKSRWETIRGVYQPEPAAVERFEDALKLMAAAWAAAQQKFAEALTPPAAG